MNLPIHQTQGRRTPRLHPLPGGLLPGLAYGRVHEICGPSHIAFALMLLALSDGPILWIFPKWYPERLYPCGIADLLPPERLVLVQCHRAEDIQWTAEEGLRSGAVPAVVAEFPEPPGLTPVRRLHLAAQAPAETGRSTALGLMLTPGEGGAQGVESRWRVRPLPPASGQHPGFCDDPGIALRIDLLRARQGPPASWRLTRLRNGQTVSQPLA